MYKIFNFEVSALNVCMCVIVAGGQAKPGKPGLQSRVVLSYLNLL